MKKILCWMMAAIVMILSAVGPVYAYGQGKGTPPGLQKKGGLPPGLMKKFNDLTNYEWAQKAIEEMASKGIIQGVGDGKYAPSSSVTKIQALAMIIRTMGWNEEAEDTLTLIQKGKIKDKLKDRLEDWGKGYIEVALEKGLIDEVDVAQENFMTPAARQDVAKYIIRALGKEKEAQKYMDVKLRFKDAAAVQTGAVGYVYLVDKLELMVGDSNNNFQPNKPMTRAEIAVLMKKVDELEKNDGQIQKITGVIYKLEGDEIQIKVNNSIKTYDIANDIKVYNINGTKISYSKLEKGMKVRLSIEEGDVIEIRVLANAEDTIEEQTFEGVITKLDTNNGKISVKVGSSEKTYTMDDDADIRLDGRITILRNLLVGMKVEVRVRNQLVIRLHAESITNSYKGKLTAVEFGTQNKLTIALTDSNKTFVIDTAAKMMNDNGDDIRPADLVKFIGKQIEIKVENYKVIRLQIL